MYKRKVTQEIKKDIKIQAINVTLNSLMKFGKYKYLTINQIIDRDAQYIVWCLNKNTIIPNKGIIDLLTNKGLIKGYDYDLKIIKK